MTSGTVGLIGWTNVGKSTLLNRLVGDKIAAVADVAQTTRHRILGVRTVPERGQIVFVDTPGLHEPRHRMNRAMVDVARRAVEGVDLAALIVDASRGFGDGDRRAGRMLEKSGVDRIVVLNKVDLVRPKSKLLPIMEHAGELGFLEIHPVSALTGDGCDRLLERLFVLLPDGEPTHPEDYFTDRTVRQLAEEWIREKLLHCTRQEIPHATAVVVESWDETEAAVRIEATILVERESQRPIVIGRGGQRLKEIGTAARLELEELLERRVHLSLWVKIRPDWRDDRRTLRELGLD